MDLETVAGELYGLPPGEFVEARDARASEAKRDGDRVLAAAVKQLRRPSTGAWLANLLVRERLDRITDLVDLGEAMRQAQKDLAGSDLRQLSQQRRQLVSALGAEARRIARDHGHQVSESSINELEGTLEAALADGAAGEALRSGCLTASLRYSGFGSVDLTAAMSAPPIERPPTSSRRDPKPRASGKGAPTGAERRQQRRLEEAEELLTESREALTVAEQAAGAAQDRLTTSSQERTGLEELMSDLEQKLRALRDEHDRAKRAERGALKNRDLANRNVRTAQGRLARATELLESLRSIPR